MIPNTGVFAPGCYDPIANPYCCTFCLRLFDRIWTFAAGCKSSILFIYFNTQATLSYVLIGHVDYLVSAGPSDHSTPLYKSCLELYIPPCVFYISSIDMLLQGGKRPQLVEDVFLCSHFPAFSHRAQRLVLYSSKPFDPFLISMR
jgi:hypothetical protein